jgi:hypothetical protein
MTSLWPWLAVAAAGALHGLNPTTGWMLAAARGLRSHDTAQALKALMPIAIGHALSIAVVAAAVALGLAMDRVVMEAVAGGLLLVVAGAHLSGRLHGRVRAPARQAGLALWSFIMATVHGAGLMLVPALVPICMGAGPARAITASGSLMLALAAVAVHTVAMLAVTGAVAAGACHGIAAGAQALRGLRGPRGKPAAAPHRAG